MRRRSARLTKKWVASCVVLALTLAFAWKQGWLPIELVDAETGTLLNLDSPAASRAATEPAQPPAGTELPQAPDDALVLTSQTEPNPAVVRQKPARSTPVRAPEVQADVVSVTRDASPTLEATHQAELASIDRKLEQGDYLKAHRQLSELYWKHPPLRSIIKPRIDKTARSIYSAPQPHYIKPYEVQPGDQLRLIARKYEVPWEYLAKLNRTSPKRIRPGQKLKVIKGPFSAVVSLSRFELTLHAHGYYVHQYQVGIGKPGTTPVGTFKVKEKLRNPTYYGPDGVVAAENPENPLGERWLGLGDGYGIHGTVEPSSIGRAESRGCVRMYAADVAEVYDLLEVGSEVIIRR